MTELEEIFHGGDEIELRVKENPRIYGIIDKYEKKSRPFQIRYFYNNIYQSTNFADDMGKAKELLKTTLEQIMKEKENKYKYVKTFESFTDNVYMKKAETNKEFTFKKCESGENHFKPSFNYKLGETEFYHVLDKNDEVVAELEMDMNIPELLSLKSYNKDVVKGAGSFAVFNILGILKQKGFDVVMIWATKDSRPFWIKMGAEKIKDHKDYYRLELYL